MRLLVDEDSQARTLVRLLCEAGHDVLTADSAGLTSLGDSEVLETAIREKRVLLTRNCGDFLALHEASPAHHGILAVYQDADPSKSMGYHESVGAVGNAESGIDLAGQFIVLNAWVTRAAAPDSVRPLVERRVSSRKRRRSTSKSSGA